MSPHRFLFSFVVFILSFAGAAVPAAEIGAARINVTPSEPIRLTGYAGRKAPHSAVEQPLWAKALAIGSDREGPAVLLTLDNCGISEATWREIRRRLRKSAGIRPDRVVVASSHTHSAPATTLWAPNIFVRDLTAEELAAIDRYTAVLIDRLEEVALTALKNRRPGVLSWAQGSVGFAANRRTRGGPSDLALPVPKAESTNGTLLALVANYACHCTTLGGEFNHVCGDWAGYAQEAIERLVPGAVGMVTIGCGVDANPSPRGGADGGLALAKQHGQAIADEVKQLLGQTFTPLRSPLSTEGKEIQLPFGPHFTRDQWLARSTNSGIVGYHAKKWLARLDRGEKLPQSLYYPITAWSFGSDLALVFMPGEVVVDYALRLKRELDGSRLWVSGYANYVPCYIPSRRILAEGGYEAEDSLWYYDRPARISTNAEDLIIRTVRDMVPASYRVDPQKADLPDPKSPAEGLKTFRVAGDLTIELAAAEPMVQSPIAIDWDAQGRMWVCEMYDYPTGINPPPDVNRKYGEPVKEPPGGFAPGGRVKVLADTDGDGRFDRVTVFLDRIPFPTGVMPWGAGALICAAPNILYAEDTDGDGRADVVRTNVTGFATHNYQARVNGFSWGLDGWLHGSSGLFGGKVKSLQTGKETDLSGRDFRYLPTTGEIEPVSGISQMGRVRDDFDHWFGNDNSSLLWHYPLPDYYLRRNPHAIAPDTRVFVARGSNPNQLAPISHLLTRFNDPQMANIVTSACGPGIYRDTLLGDDYLGNAFICEPVHNLIRRLVLRPEGLSYAGTRGPDEQRVEFLASTDNWFRPVQVRTGPDGALYVVDMYRFVIEHPRWIPPERLKSLDVRAGADKGRIYRLVPKGKKLRPVPNLRSLGPTELARAMNTPNGPVRDHVQMRLTFSETTDWKTRDAALVILRDLAANGSSGAIRAQALASIPPSVEVLQSALDDADEAVRCVALRQAEGLMKSGTAAEELTAKTIAQMSSTNRSLAFQAVLTMGYLKASRVPVALAEKSHDIDRWMQAAVLSSATGRAGKILREIRSSGSVTAAPALMNGLVATAAESGSTEEWADLLQVLAPEKPNASGQENLEPWRLEGIASLLEALRRNGGDLKSVTQKMGAEQQAGAERIEALLRGAGTMAADPKAGRTARLGAIKLLGAWDQEAGVQVLTQLLVSSEPEFHPAVVTALARSRRSDIGDQILGNWKSLAPSVRARAIGVLLDRPVWTQAFLNAIERGDVRPSEVSPAQRQRLLNAKNETAVRERASKIFVAGKASDRTEVFKKYESVPSLKGDSAKGGAIFDKACAQCHALRGRGFDVGPNLAEFAGKTSQDFLLAILDPNAGINPNFIGYNLELKDGRSLSGLIRNETATGVTLVQAGGVRETISRQDLVEMRAADLSIMPEGLEQGLTSQELADLIAWIKGSQPRLFGSSTADQASQARAAFLQEHPARAIEVTKAVERLPYPGWLGRWPLAYCRQNAGQESLAWNARPGADPKANRVVFRFPAAMGFVSQPRGEFSLQINEAPCLNFEVGLRDNEWHSADGRVTLRYSVVEASNEDSCGIVEIDVPQSMAASNGATRFSVVGSPSNSQRWFGLYLIE